MSALTLKHSDPFKKFVMLSLGAHFAVVLVFNISSLITSNDELIIQNAIRVDMVALPDKAFTQEKPKVIAKPKPLVKVSKVKPKKQLSAFDKLKELEQREALNKLKKIQEKKAQKAKADTPNVTKEKVKPVVNKGNAIADAGDLSGMDRIQMQRYYADLKAHILEHWSLPQWLEDQNLKAQAKVQIDERGFVVFSQIETSSNNAIFDATVLTTIKNASPLPAPPARLSSTLKNQGFILNFPE